MSNKTFVSLAVIATVVAAALAGSLSAHAQPRSNNPLHPSYFLDRTSVGKIKARGTGSVATNLNTTNPLHPTYFLARLAGKGWVSTMSAKSTPWRDTRNPLHPGFDRR